MKKIVRRVLLVVLALVFLGSAGMLIWRNMDYQSGAENYAEAEELVELPDFDVLPSPTLEPTPSDEDAQESEEVVVYVDPYADALRNMDFSALRAVNSDVLGWIVIPGTAISYPLLQGDDNDYYLNHTWKGWRSAVGAIYLEWQCAADLSDFNTVVYGHRMRNGSMFAGLKYFDSQSYWAAHPCVYITDDNGSHKYDIFAAYEAGVESTTYRLGLAVDSSKQEYIDYCLSQSVIDTGIVPTVYDRILTLSTCTGDGYATRWVVQAVLKGEAPSDAAQESQEPEASTEPSPQPEVSAEPSTQPEVSAEPTPEETTPVESEPAEPAPESSDPGATESAAPADGAEVVPIPVPDPSVPVTTT